MKVAIRDFPHRMRLDRQYLETMRPKMQTCPKCGRRDGLKVEFDPECYFSIYCNYRIKCDACGFAPKKWSESVFDAVKEFDQESINYNINKM